MSFENIIQSKIYSKEEILKHCKHWKSKNQTIVFTNGCFDILHYGHIYYLSKAKDLGDKLIIGLNSDNSVKRLKGESRPVNNQLNRACMLASLIVTDAIVIFEEDTPADLIESISPSILVKAADYKLDEIAGSDYVIKSGGRVEIIDFVEGYSSTELIKKINK
jgi:D-glycero-beta-D-manno-heptose 1-phosphate adenylyltransferase